MLRAERSSLAVFYGKTGQHTRSTEFFTSLPPPQQKLGAEV
jgi:hypothetical protein